MPLAVRALQTALTTVGYYQGAIDGDWGPASMKAMADFRLDELHGP